MEIWLDTTNVNLVASAHSLGILQGVTTNPTLLASSTLSLQQLIKELLEAQAGIVAIQVLSEDVEGICAEAETLSGISDRILVKIPVTQNGLRAMHALRQKEIPTLATALFEPRQALLAFKAGASYLAPYLGRIADTGKNPIDVLSEMQMIRSHYGFSGKIMGAGIRECSMAMACVQMGISAMTLSEKVFNELIQDSQHTLHAIEKFASDFSKSPHAGMLLSTPGKK